MATIPPMSTARAAIRGATFTKGRAERVLIASPELRVLFERSPDDYDPIGLARHYMQGADIVLTEGYKAGAPPQDRGLPQGGRRRSDLRPGLGRMPASGWRL